MDRKTFEKLVDQALEVLPPEFADRLDNVDVRVEEEPSAETLRMMGLGGRGTLLGLYQGVSQLRRTTRYSLVMPDRITIYRRPILAAARANKSDDQSLDDAVRDQVRRTVLHEIGHHFGLGEADLRDVDM